MDLEKLRELIQIFEAAGIAEIEIEEEGSRILLKKASPAPPTPPQTHFTATLPGGGMPHPPYPAQYAPPPPAPQQGQPAPAETAAEEEPDEDEGLVTIDAPMVGVFYSAPAPGEPPFVKLGDEVEADQTVCIVEAMKLMNEVTAKFPCVVEKVLVENAEPVEFGQPLFAVRPLDQG